jgi:hypothetical protein
LTDRISIVHALDGAGMPLVSRCLGAMKDIVLLSRVHPSGANGVNPLQQAREWFELISDDDLERLRKQEDWPYNEIIQMILERAERAGKKLIVTDWSNPDFVADKPVSELQGMLFHSAVLETEFDVSPAALIRHPIDQWIDLQNAEGPGAPKMDIFLRGCARFAANLDGVDFIRYEDFLSDPETALQKLCDILDAPFDPDWENNWREYSTFMSEPAAQKSEGAEKLTFDDDLLAKFKADENYAAAIQSLGYNGP